MRDLCNRLVKGERLNAEEMSQISRIDAELLEQLLEQLGAEERLLGWNRHAYPEAEGGRGLHAVIEIAIHPDWLAHLELVSGYISGQACVESCYLIPGDHELLVFVRSLDVHQMAVRVRDFFANAPGVSRCETHFLVTRFEDQGYRRVRREEGEGTLG